MAMSQRKKYQEIGGLLLLFFTVLLVLSLVTYHPEDPSLNVSNSSNHTDNFIGRTGAWVSDFLYNLFGFGVFLLVVPLLITAYKLLRKREFSGYFNHFIGMFLLLLSLDGLLALLDARLPLSVNFPPGGVIGGALKSVLVYYLNTGGAATVLGAAMLTGLLLLTTWPVEDLWSWIRHFRRGRNSESEPEGPGAEASDESVPMDASEPPEVSFAVREPVSAAASTGGARGDGEQAANQPKSPAAIPISRLVLKEESPAEPAVLTSIKPDGGKYKLPASSFLDAPTSAAKITENELMEKAQQIIHKYAEFGVDGSIDAIHPGPVVTLFEFKPGPGVKYSRMVSLVDDLCLGLKAESVRVDRIPGKSTVGIEVPNSQRQTIFIRELLESREFQTSRSRLTLALGKRINGDVYVTDLAKMPHLLVAGATGSGKSVGLNTMITSILYKATPAEVKFIFIDPKRLELGMYQDIPHLLTPIVTDAKMAANTLIWAVHEMEERYKLLAKYAVKDIDNFNRLCLENDELEPLPYIVIVIDEVAELLSVAAKEVEICLQRLAQMARAVGIHIIIATQRPSVEIVTGVIKANFPSRISFRLLSRHDSKTILDTVGAEHLLGKGDMLFLPPNTAKMIRIHGGYISEEETKQLVERLKGQQEPDYRELNLPAGEEDEMEDSGDLADDPLYDEIARFIVTQRKASTSILQRRFRVGYGRAARLMDLLEEDGIIGEANGSRPREVLVPPNYFKAVDETKGEE